MASYRWYSVGIYPHGDGKVTILGWSRDRLKAMRVRGTIEAYYASSRQMAARKARADRGFEIEWRKYNVVQRAEMAQTDPGTVRVGEFDVDLTPADPGPDWVWPDGGEQLEETVWCKYCYKDVVPEPGDGIIACPDCGSGLSLAPPGGDGSG